MKQVICWENVMCQVKWDGMASAADRRIQRLKSGCEVKSDWMETENAMPANWFQSSAKCQELKKSQEH